MTGHEIRSASFAIRWAATLIVAAASLSAQNPCQPVWTPGVSGIRGVDGVVRAIAAFDDGSGSALYAGGTFLNAGTVRAPRIARWNGVAWSGVGTGMDGSVLALATFDDGSGPALYAGGGFNVAGGTGANSIARWNGLYWSPVGAAANGVVLVLQVYDDGSGPALYAGGNFTQIGGIAANGIAKWNAAGWSALGGVAGLVQSMAVHDEGSGPSLFVGGAFTAAGGVPAANIARWNGTWSALGAGTDAAVTALRSFDDGSGPALFAGGYFLNAGTVAAAHVARWNGVWSALGGGLAPGTSNVAVDAFAVFDLGSGPALYAGGSTVATWTGTTWQTVIPNGGSRFWALLPFDDGTGPALFVGGAIGTVSGSTAHGITRWNGAPMPALGSGFDRQVTALDSFDFGTGTNLVAGGDFSFTGSAAALRVARWDGAVWSPLGTGLGGTGQETVTAFATHDDGSGPSLFAAGYFGNAGATTVNSIARWTGTSWSPVGGGLTHYSPISGTSGPASVVSLAVYDPGTGPELFAASRDGLFSGSASLGTVARWNGTAWSSTGQNSRVFSMVVFDDGTGPALYAAGQLLGSSAVVRWRRGAWQPVGNTGGIANSLTVFDNGTGPMLIAAWPDLRRWDRRSGTWIPLGGILNTSWVLGVHDDGSGPALYTTSISNPLSSSAAQLARWNGQQWQYLNGFFNGAIATPSPSSATVNVLRSADLGRGPSLFAGGNFLTAGGQPSSAVAEWHASGPVVSLAQPGGPGTQGFLRNAGLVPGVEYFNVLSLEPCPGPPGSGPYLGLCATNPALLAWQLLEPLGNVPFHFIATANTTNFGPFPVPPGLTIEAVCFSPSLLTGGCTSPVRRYVTQ
jgi:hypothetical protein